MPHSKPQADPAATSQVLGACPHDCPDTCALLTTEANDLMRPIHDRMPVILHRADFEPWLTADPDAAFDLHALLRPYPANLMTAWPVSPLVNTPRNDGPQLAEPVKPADPGEQYRLLD